MLCQKVILTNTDHSVMLYRQNMSHRHFQFLGVSVKENKSLETTILNLQFAARVC